MFSQYSEKENKYEEEIKILSDKLKEVSLAIPKLSLGIIFLGASGDAISTFFRLKLVQNLQRELLPNWKSLLMTWKVWNDSSFFKSGQFQIREQILGVGGGFYWERTAALVRHIGRWV